MELLDGDDNYARDAARTTLEQQGFLDKHLAALDSDDFRAKSRARHFFIKMANQGQSSIARELVKKYHLDGSSSTPPESLEADLENNEYSLPNQALRNQKGS
jgi:hypothetical protein